VMSQTPRVNKIDNPNVLSKRKSLILKIVNQSRIVS
jgi:hypothetical protein